MRGHDTDSDPLGAAPSSGQAEQYAAYRAAWRALGRPDIDRDVMEMTDGQLRIRVRAAQHEETWGPRYVGNELAGTRQAADAHRHAAALRAAEADAAAEPAEQQRLHMEAAQARALAETLDARAEQLQFVDDARAHFLATSAVTRVEGAESAAELSRRHVDDIGPDPQVTAQEWLDAHRRAIVEEDAHRPVSETDVDTRLHDASLDDVLGQADPAEIVDGPQPDIREIAAGRPAHGDTDRVRVSTPDEAAEWTANAREALAEIHARQAMDARHEEEERAAELARWHDDDHRRHSADALDVGAADDLDDGMSDSRSAPIGAS